MHMGGKPHTPPAPASLDPQNYKDLLAMHELPDLPNIPDFADLEKQIRNLETPNFELPNLPDISSLDEISKLQELLNNNLLSEDEEEDPSST